MCSWLEWDVMCCVVPFLHVMFCPVLLSGVLVAVWVHLVGPQLSLSHFLSSLSPLSCLYVHVCMCGSEFLHMHCVCVCVCVRATALKGNSTLSTLNLNNNEIGNTGLALLAGTPVFCFCVCVSCVHVCVYVWLVYVCASRTLFVCINMYAYIYVWAYVCMHICMCICINARIYVCMHVHVCMLRSDMLKTNSSIQRLDVSGNNQISDDGVEALAQALECNRSSLSLFLIFFLSLISIYLSVYLTS